MSFTVLFHHKEAAFWKEERHLPAYTIAYDLTSFFNILYIIRKNLLPNR